MKSLIAAHDAGGAEVLVAMIQANAIGLYDVYAEGPAKVIFSRNNISCLAYVPDDLTVYSRLICGTSMGTDIENTLTERCNRLGVFTIAVLDHWIHYQDRFLNTGTQVLPRELWVCDGAAKRLAEDLFSNTLVQLKPSWYGDKIKKLVKPSENNYWLLACENRVFKPGGLVQAFRQAKLWLEGQMLDQLIVRPHPTTTAPELISAIAILKDVTCPVVISEVDLVSDLSAVVGVIGFQTTLLALALSCGKRAVSLVSGDEKLLIPLAGIETPMQS